MGTGRGSNDKPSRQTTELDQLVGARLRERRNSLHLSQEQVGDQLGLTFQQVQKYEKGTNRISASRLYEISRILNVDIGFFFEGFEDANDNQVMGFGEEQAAFGRSFVDQAQRIVAENFARIPDPEVRQSVFELVERLAKADSA